MTALYTKSYYNKIKKQKKILLTVYLVLLAIAVISVVGIIVFYSLQPYGTSLKNPLKFLMYSIVVIFCLFSGIYLTIVYGRVNKYLKFLGNLASAKKLNYKITVISINYGDIRTNYGVDFYTMEVLEWSETQSDYVKHNLLVDAEFKDLDINEGEILTVKTSLNALMEYNKD